MIWTSKLIVLYVLTLWTSFCYGQSRAYRADTRGPEELRRTGGFYPRGNARALIVAPNVSMFNHANGAASGASTDDDGYVSTSVNERRATQFLSDMFGGTGYVYTIAPAENFIQVQGTLLQFNPYPGELEYAVLGGFVWARVVGWQQYQNGNPVGQYIQNPDHDAARYGSGTGGTSIGNPSLAGFPNGHAAWLLSPWNSFANGNCPRTLRLRQTNCGAWAPQVQIAQQELDRLCGESRCR